jgi:uncharacterized Tic20 family protein
MQSSSYSDAGFHSDYTPTSDEKTLAILSHILTLAAPILAPLIIYLLKKDESKYVAYHAKESLNFQITMMIVFVCLLISVVGIFLIWIPGIIAFVLVIIATIRTSEGVLYKYPFSLRLIK